VSNSIAWADAQPKENAKSIHKFKEAFNLGMIIFTVAVDDFVRIETVVELASRKSCQPVLTSETHCLQGHSCRPLIHHLTGALVYAIRKTDALLRVQRRK